MKNKFILLLKSVVFICMSFGFADESGSWAETALKAMSQDEKIGQLFMIAGYVDPEYAERELGNRCMIEEIDHYITHYHIGGIAFVGPSEFAKQVALTNHYQELSKTPILIAQDFEWGLSMRIKEAMRFPKNITLGAVEDNQLIYEMGKEIGNQAKRIGVHMNLSPVLDVNINPQNPVINVRSFGSCPKLVAEKGIAMIRGLQDAGIIASAKHFPGLGDISIDPHLDLPSNLHGKERLYDVELHPFIQAINAGVLSIQTDHVLFATLDPQNPSSLSPKIVNDLLKGELGFSGLVLSGALRMKALTNTLSEDEIVVRAFLAGSDMLLMPGDFPRAFRALKKAHTEGKISEEEIDERVLKILKIKERVKLDQKKKTAIPTVEELHSPYARDLKKRLYQSAVSLIRGDVSTKGPIAYVQLGEPPSNHFVETLSRSLPLDPVLSLQMEKYSHIILAVYPEGIDHQMLQAFEKFQDKTIVVYFGSPFGLHLFDEYSTLIMAFETDPDAELAAEEILLRQ